MDPRLALIVRVAATGLIVAASLAVAQTAPAPGETPPTPPIPATLPPPPQIGPAVEAPPQIVKPKPVRKPSEPVLAPVEPPPPLVLRSPVAVLQVLDKVTAETLRFEAPVGRKVRYKTLVVEVKVCETRGYKDVEPRSSAYLIVSSRLTPLQASQAPAVSELFHGWTFAGTPSLHGLEHPVYDLWLVACSASAPPA